MRTLHFTAQTAGERLDVFLARQAPDFSRSFLQQLCQTGMVTGAHGELSANHKLKPGEEVTVLLPEQPDFSQESLPVLYEDDDVLVINKPAGLLTHAKGALSQEFTVAEFVRPRTTDNQASNRPGIVHRLDRGTSGLLIAAKHSEAKRWLQKQFSERKVKKRYTALVEGHLADLSAMIELPIERNPQKPQTFRVAAGGREAITVYEVAKTFARHSLLTLRPLTGRTHQLRVHLAYLGHAIIGDQLYGHAKSDLERLFLHAAELELTLPSRERKSFVAPLPPELSNYLKTLNG